MVRVTPVGQANSGAGLVAPVLDLVESRGTGDLLVTCNSEYGGEAGAFNVIVSQGPTDSGPWVPLPGGTVAFFMADPGGPSPNVVRIPFTWSQRYLQVTLDIGATNAGTMTGVLLRPGGNTFN